MITLAGELVAHLSDMTYEQLVKFKHQATVTGLCMIIPNMVIIECFQISEFFQQVNMTDSTYFDKKGDYEKLPNLAKPYVKIGDNVVEYNVHMLR